MTKKISYLVILLTAFTFLQNCIKHDTGGVSTSTIILFSGKTITEASSNNGTFNETITATLEGTEFSDTLTSKTDFDTIGLPDGLTVSVTRVSATKVSIHFSGQAVKHSFCSNGQMSFYFNASAFKDGQLPISFEIPIAVQYISPVLTYSGFILDESGLNDGTFLQTITVTAQNGGTFSHSSGTLVLDTDYSFTGIPAGITPVITLNSSTQATITFTGSAAANTPESDVTAKLKFNASALSSDFCAALAKKDVDFVFYRSVLMYAVSTTSGDLKGTAASARAGADALCDAGKPTSLPADYTGIRAFISTGVADDIISMPSNYLISSTAIVEAVNVNGVSTALASNWSGLLDGAVDNNLDTAQLFITTTDYWTGSDSTGAYIDAAHSCNGWTSGLMADVGEVGDSSLADTNWLDNTTPDTCDSTIPILCIAFVPQ